MNSIEILHSLSNLGFRVTIQFLSFVWQSSIVLLFTLLLLNGLRNYRADFRHKIAVTGLLAVPLIPLISLILNPGGTSLISIPVPVSSPAIVAGNPTVSSTFAGLELPGLASIQSPDYKDLLWLIAPGFIILVITFSLVRIISTTIRLISIRKSSNPVTGGDVYNIFRQVEGRLCLTKNVRLYTNRDISIPFTAGILSPSIYLPSSISGSFNQSDLESILLHELIHTRRNDVLFNCTAYIMQTFLFFNPLLAAVARITRETAEEACDDELIGYSIDRLKYARLLTSIAERNQERNPVMLLSTGFAASISRFRLRVENILGKNPGRKTSIRSVVTAMSVLVLAITAAVATPIVGTYQPDIIINYDGQVTVDDMIRIPDLLPIRTSGDLRISSGFGMRLNPFTHKKDFHEGIDIPADSGTPVYATAEGEVKKSAFDENRGHFVVIRHENDCETYYTHLQKRLVNGGERVNTNTMIGQVGSTGKSTGAHIHYAIYVDGSPVDPLNYLQAEVRTALKPGRNSGGYIGGASEGEKGDAGSKSDDFDTPPKQISEKSIWEYITEQKLFPKKALEQNVSGTVTLNFEVNEAGVPVNIEVKSEEPEGYEFAEACKAAMKAMKFTPAYKCGKPVRAQLTQTFKFNISKDKVE